MRVAGKRIPRGNVLLILGMLAVSICTIMMSAALHANYMNELQSRAFYSKKARKFNVTECENVDFWESLMEELPDDLILYHQIMDDTVDIRAVYVKGNVELPQMLWGRFFQETDQFKSKPTAVVGRDLEGQLIRELGKLYFVYEGQRYEVLGVMGYPWESRVDHMVYIDYASGLTEINSDGQYILDGRSEQIIEQGLDLLEKKITDCGQINVGIQDRTESVLERYADGGIGVVVYILIYISFFLSVVIITSMWLGYRRKEMGIAQMLGFTDRELFGMIGKDFFSACVVAWIFGAVVSWGISFDFIIIELRWIDLLVSFMITVMSGAAAFTFPFQKSVRTEISVNMR